MSYEELKNLSTEELTNKLIEMDSMLIQNHQNGHYVKNPWMDGTDDREEQQKAKKMDIIGLCITGICAYNKLSLPNANDGSKFLNDIIQNLEVFFEYGHIPSFMQKYYIAVLNEEDKIDYLNNYLLKNGYEDEAGMDKGRTLTKSTAAGRAFSEKDNSAFANVLLLPAMLVLTYISVVVIYFMFFYSR